MFKKGDEVCLIAYPNLRMHVLILANVFILHVANWKILARYYEIFNEDKYRVSSAYYVKMNHYLKSASSYLLPYFV